MRQALGLVESAWFFRRGEHSVRIVRLGHPGSKLSLVVDGPGTSHVTHRFDNPLACAIHQSEIERRLVTRDFYLERSTGKPASVRLRTMAQHESGLRLLFEPPALGGDSFNEPPPAAA